ncbi:MAG: hypothetical protein IKZ88_06225 [Neisseriaceae bacterium]|nr:hypothetical protein [Neisseriaceae bacterium]
MLQRYTLLVKCLQTFDETDLIRLSVDTTCTDFQSPSVFCLGFGVFGLPEKTLDKLK